MKDYECFNCKRIGDIRSCERCSRIYEDMFEMCDTGSIQSEIMKGSTHDVRSDTIGRQEVIDTLEGSAFQIRLTAEDEYQSSQLWTGNFIWADDIRSVIDSLLPADGTQPARWIDHKYSEYGYYPQRRYECSNCGKMLSDIEYGSIKPKFCPECGRKMEEAHELV